MDQETKKILVGFAGVVVTYTVAIVIARKVSAVIIEKTMSGH